MKFAIPAVALLLLFGMSLSTSARQEKGQEEHKQEARPAQQQRQEKPAAQHARPAQQQQTQRTSHAQPQHSEQAAHTRQSQTHVADRTQQNNDGRSQARVQPTHAATGNRGGSEHGRISDAHYASSFGSGHSFHVNRGEYNSRRFAYGGYSFGFVDPWPIGWGYSDDVYVVYSDGGYYMYDRVHPGLRISVNIL